MAGMSARSQAALCALRLFKVPGDKPTGGATWNRGHVRIGSTGSEVQTFPTAPTVTTPCTESMTEPASGGGFSAGGMVLDSKGPSLVFKVDLGFPGQGCDYGFHGEAVPLGKVCWRFPRIDQRQGAQDGVRTLPEGRHHVSSDPTHGPKPNCGVVPASSGGADGQMLPDRRVAGEADVVRGLRLLSWTSSRA